MSDTIELNAQLRADIGKGASRRLRRLQNLVPAIVYGGGETPVSISLRTNELVKAAQEEVFFSQIMNLSVDGKSEQVVLRDVQRHPATNAFMHLDFMRVRADQVIKVSVPIHFLNEESCVGVRLEGGTIDRILIEVEVSCLPGDLPEYLEVDLAEVAVGESVHLTEISLPENVEIVALGLGDDHDTAVVTVRAAKGGGDEEELDEAAPEAAEGDAESDGDDE